MQQDPLFSVAGQVVLVSGASRGIGRALAEGFALRDAHVIIAGREQATIEQTAREISRGAHPVQPVVADVAKPADIERLVADTLKRHGRIDTLVNVAGVNKRMKAESYSLEEYEWIMNINLRGAFLMSQQAGRNMIERRAGNIINIDSLNTYAPLKGVTPYAMSKGGMSLMTRSMANEWGQHNVRVNAIAPGFFPTELSRKLWQQPGMLEWGQTNTPLRRLGEMGELVGAAVFLASEAARFVTGQILRVDGGVSAGFNWPIEL